jgi:hypothetical protein
MTYQPLSSITLKTIASLAPENLDAFLNLKTSSLGSIYSTKNITSNTSPNVFSSNSTNGGTVVLNEPNSEYVLTVPATANASAIQQTRKFIDFSVGKPCEILIGFRAPTFSGVTQRIGYFSCGTVSPYMTPEDGIFFENSSGSISWKIAKNGVINETAPQSLWNVDKLDGSGPSGKTLNLNACQIAFISFDWLGAGSVYVGFLIDGEPIIAHRFLHTNDSTFTSPYMRVPNLPVRSDIFNNTGTTTGTLQVFGFSVGGRGGARESSTDNVICGAADRGITGFTTGSSVNLLPILSIRANSRKVNYRPTNIHIMTTTTQDFRWAVYINPTIAGTDGAVWVPVNGSSITYDTSRTISNTLSGGILVKSGYLESINGGSIDIALPEDISLGSSVNGAIDQLVVAIQNTSAQSEIFFASIEWKEFI